MCLLVFAWRSHPRYELVLAGNRDEFHDRAAAPADWWVSDPDLLAGRDELAGGSWLGVARDGRLAVVTNYREGGNDEVGQASRGALVTDFLTSGRRPSAWSAEVDGARFAGFNLLTFDADEACYLSNRASRPETLSDGVHGLSNHRLDTPWPKLVRTRAGFDVTLEEPVVDPEALFSLLGDRRAAADAELPETGVPIDWERLLSAPFIVHPTYGTRASTVVTISVDGEICFEERRFGPDGTITGTSTFGFSRRQTDL